MTPDLDERQPELAARPGVDIKQIWRPALLFVASRALVLLAFAVAAAAHPQLGLKHATVDWDGGFYLRIARFGYPTLVRPRISFLIAFFPLWPSVIRGGAALTGASQYGTAITLVFVFGLAAASCVWFLTNDLADAAAADRATALFAFAPGSFVLSMTYSEALFVLCAAAALWAFVRNRWILGGIIAALGTATRPDGLAIVLAAAFGAYVAYKRRKEWRALVAVPLAASGAIVYELYLWRHTGNLFAYSKVQRDDWYNRTTLGTGRWQDIHSLVMRTIVHGVQPDWNHVVPLAGMVIFAAAFVVLVRWHPPTELIGYALGIGLLAFTSTQVGFRPRVLMVAFPLWIAVGARVRRGPWFAVLLGSSAALLVALAVVSPTTRYLTP